MTFINYHGNKFISAKTFWRWEKFFASLNAIIVHGTPLPLRDFVINLSMNWNNEREPSDLRSRAFAPQTYSQIKEIYHFRADNKPELTHTPMNSFTLFSAGAKWMKYELWGCMRGDSNKNIVTLSVITYTMPTPVPWNERIYTWERGGWKLKDCEQQK